MQRRPGLSVDTSKEGMEITTDSTQLKGKLDKRIPRALSLLSSNSSTDIKLCTHESQSLYGLSAISHDCQVS